MNLIIILLSYVRNITSRILISDTNNQGDFGREFSVLYWLIGLRIITDV
ncbi:hypothetical protein VCRA2119O241_500006 [Vibrio crassostreae]|nr:hypothetical protein VCRA2119O241_500006 [Vibrio crassostreae]